MFHQIILVLLIIAILFFISFPFIKRIVLKNKFVSIYGNKVKTLAKKNNLVTLNSVKLANINNEVEIDHIIFGKKFIYLITDFYFDGFINGDEKSNSWIYVTSFKKNASYIKNLLALGKEKITSFSEYGEIDKNVLVHISFVNGGCELKIDSKNDGNSLVVKTRELYRMIKKFESQNIKEFDKEQLKVVIEEIVSKNEKGK